MKVGLNSNFYNYTYNFKFEKYLRIIVVEKKNGNNEISWWKQRIGMFADNPDYDEAMRLGQEYRESQKMVYDEDDKK